jgi:hypothetical protein
VTALRGSTSRWVQRGEWSGAFALTLAVIWLHLLRLFHAGALWRDEANTYQSALLPWRELLPLLQFESFPLLVPLAVRTFIGLWHGLGLPAQAYGSPDLAARAFGLLVGLASLAILWLVARWTAGRPPLVSLALAGLSPFVLIFGDSLRGYGLGSALLLLTFGLFARLVASPPGRQLGWLAVAIGLAAVATAQSLLPAVPMLVGLAVGAALVGRHYGRPVVAMVALGSVGVAGLSLLPELPLLAGRRTWNALVTPDVDPLQLASALRGALAAPVSGSEWVWMLLAGLALGGVLLERSRNPLLGQSAPDTVPASTGPAAALLYCRLALPLALVSLVTFLTILQYEPRPWYFVPLLLLAAATLELPLATLAPGGWWRLAVVGLVLVLGLVWFVPDLHLARLRLTNIDLAAAEVTAQAGPDDLVIVQPWHLGVSFGRNFRGVSRWVTLPEIADHRVHRYDLAKARMAEAAPLAALLADVERTLRSGHRLWLVGDAVNLSADGSDAPPPAPGGPQGWLEEPYLHAWAHQLGAFLGHHAAGSKTTAPGHNLPISGYERAVVTVVWGWADAAPAAPPLSQP